MNNIRLNGVTEIPVATMTPTTMSPGDGALTAATPLVNPLGGLTLQGAGRSLTLGAMHQMTDPQVPARFLGFRGSGSAFACGPRRRVRGEGGFWQSELERLCGGGVHNRSSAEEDAVR